MKPQSYLITIALFVLTFFLFTGKSTAQNGALDLSFGNLGKVTTPIGVSEDVANSVAIQSDGKIIVAGSSYIAPNWNFAILRYKTDGTLDNTFGNGGKVTTDIDSTDYGNSVAIQNDGKIIVAGNSMVDSNVDFALVRYNTDGTLDNTFGNGGKVTTAIGNSDDRASSVTIQSDGKIVVTGSSNNNGQYTEIALVRYNTNGTLDNTFGTGGKTTIDISSSHDGATSVAIQGDGKIVIGGSSKNTPFLEFTLIRYNTNGTLDNSFGTGGIVITDIGVGDDYINKVVIQNDGKIVAAGIIGPGSSADFALARYNTDGTLDNSFGTGGKVTTNIGVSSNAGYSAAIQANGKIIVVGNSFNGTVYDIAAACYNTDGTLDNNFGTGGTVTTPFGPYDAFAHSVAIQSDGKIVAAGWTIPANRDFCLVRYNNTVIMGLDNNTDQHTTIYNYPNPFSTGTTFKSATSFNNASLLVYNSFGQVVKQLNNLSGTEIELQRGNLPAGIYAVHLIQDNKTITTDELIIID